MITLLNSYTVNYYRLAGVLAAGWVLHWLLLYTTDRFFHRKKWLADDQHVHNFLKSALIALVILVAVDVSVSGLEKFNQRLFIVCGFWVLVRLLKVLKLVCYVRFDASRPDNLTARKVRTQISFIEKT